MPIDFLTLGEMNNTELAEKFREWGDEETASSYETAFNEEALFTPAWKSTNNQIGFVPLFTSNERFQPIVSASTVAPDASLKGTAIIIRLDWLHAPAYPRAFVDGVVGTNHSILFSAEAHNQTNTSSEVVVFNQVYEVRGGEDAGVRGYPIFTGLNVGNNGVIFSCGTVNVCNTQDEKLLNAIKSPAMEQGLQLLKVAQPGLIPFVKVAQGLAETLAVRNRNAGIQKLQMGLDFEPGATGVRLALGSYLVVQVPQRNELSWADWCYDTQTGSVVSTKLNRRDKREVLPYNALLVRVSKHIGD